MDKQAYEQRVRTLAEKMYIDQYGMSDTEKRLHCARIAVAEMAEAIRDFLIDYAVSNGASMQSLDQYLKDKGLIPDDGQEVSNHE